MKTRNIITLVIVGLVTVAAIVFLIIGITTHEEPGLLRVQWAADGTIRYAETEGQIESWREFPGWEGYDLPLRVAAQTTNPYPPNEPETATRSAIDIINDRLGFEVMRLDGGECDEAHAVCVNIGEAYEEGFMDAHGDARHERLPSGMRCVVRTSNTGTVEVLHYVLQHELGHCLGLAHDHFDDSIMCGRNPYNGREDCELSSSYEGFPPRITDDDREVLRDLYGH